METTRNERIDELLRELAIRKNCYPRWVKEGKMAQETADHRLDVLLDLVSEQRELRDKESGQERMF